MTLVVLIESAVFWLWEYALTRFGMHCGEEIMLRATVSEEHRQGAEEAAG